MGQSCWTSTGGQRELGCLPRAGAGSRASSAGLGAEPWSRTCPSPAGPWQEGLLARREAECVASWAHRPPPLASPWEAPAPGRLAHYRAQRLHGVTRNTRFKTWKSSIFTVVKYL